MALKFFWRCEGTTLDGTHDFTGGDNAATLNSTAAINTDAAKIGTNGLDIPSSTDYAEFAVSSDDIISRSAGAVGFWFRVTTWGAGATLFHAFGTAANDQISLSLSGTSELLFRHRVSGVTNLTLTTTDASLTTATWYFVVIRWDDAANDRRLEIYDTAGSLVGTPVEDLTTAFGQQTDLITLRIGDVTGTACDVHIDNVFIADSYSEDLPTWKDITSYTEYGVSGAIEGPMVGGKLTGGGLLMRGSIV